MDGSIWINWPIGLPWSRRSCATGRLRVPDSSRRARRQARASPAQSLELRHVLSRTRCRTTSRHEDSLVGGLVGGRHDNPLNTSAVRFLYRHPVLDRPSRAQRPSDRRRTLHRTCHTSSSHGRESRDVEHNWDRLARRHRRAVLEHGDRSPCKRKTRRLRRAQRSGAPRSRPRRAGRAACRIEVRRPVLTPLSAPH